MTTDELQKRKPNNRARPKSGRALKNMPIYLCLLPGLLFLFVFSYYPFFSAFYFSLFKWDGVNSAYIGIQNFINISHDDRLVPAVKNIVILTTAGVFWALTLPLLGAVCINNFKSSKTARIYLIIFTIPMVIPWVVTVLVWQVLYDPIDGPINRFLYFIGLSQFAKAWLADYETAIWALTLIGGGNTGVAFPFVAGMNLLVYLAGLINVPSEVKEAAKLEGATTWQIFYRIELPLIRTQVRINLIMTIITQLQAFQTVILLTRGGPGYATMVPGFAMYQDAFFFSKMGYASTLGVVLFLIMMLITIVVNKSLKSPTDFKPD